ncbi:MAG: hypothetical protein JJU10_05410 [Idiomarina sp.]|nr:hypothetical protein [Idiomarina sp.]
MSSGTDWKFYAAVSTCLFLAGTVIGATLSIDAESIALVASLVTAFGTVLLGIAAIYGVSNWYNQQQFLKRGERAEKALKAMASISQPAERILAYTRSHRPLPPEAPANQIMSWGTLTKNRFIKVVQAATEIKEQLTVAKQLLIWFENDSIKGNISSMLEHSEMVLFAASMFWDPSDADTLSFENREEQGIANAMIKELLDSTPKLIEAHSSIQRFLIPLAELKR